MTDVPDTTDEHEVISVRFADGEVDWVTLTADWQEHYEPLAMCAELSRLIRDSLPPQELPTPPEHTSTEARELSYEQATAYWRQFDMVQDLLDQRLERILNRPAGPGFEESRTRTVLVRHSNGRFESIEADPEWLTTAARQSICQALTEALRERPLVGAKPDDPESAEIDRRRADMAMILSGN